RSFGIMKSRSVITGAWWGPGSAVPPGKDTPGPNVALAETLPWHAWPPGVQTIATAAVRRQPPARAAPGALREHRTRRAGLRLPARRQGQLRRGPGSGRAGDADQPFRGAHRPGQPGVP